METSESHGCKQQSWSGGHAGSDNTSDSATGTPPAVPEEDGSNSDYQRSTNSEYQRSTNSEYQRSTNGEYQRSTIPDMTNNHALSDMGTMEEQAMDDPKNPSQQDSAYGSLESSSQGQSQKSSYSGSKSLNSGSSHSSGFGDNADYRLPIGNQVNDTTQSCLSDTSSFLSSSFFQNENRISVTEVKHKEHKKRKTKDKIEKLLLKEKSEQAKEEEKEKEAAEATENAPRLTIVEPTTTIVSAVPEETPQNFSSQNFSSQNFSSQNFSSQNFSSQNFSSQNFSSQNFSCLNKESEEPIFEQPTLVYTQALHYIRKIKERSVEQGLPLTSPELKSIPRDSHEVAAFLKSFKNARGFTAAISVHDGTVLHVSPSITEVLGFPKDMLIGQSFIDFVYPRDSINLSSKIIHGMNPNFGSETIKDSSGTSFFCRMRMYHGLKSSGFGVRNKRTLYKPCKMTLKVHDTSNAETPPGVTPPRSNLLLANVIPIESAYSTPEEVPAINSFSTRHTGGCNFSEYDPEAIPYLGHLPQDLVGHSVFDYYHPTDLPFLRSVYEKIVNNQGKLYKSKPYRFRAFNGSYVLLETEWLCFVNPWSKKIESIIGQHHIVKGPSDIAIFLDPCEKIGSPLPDEIMKEAKKAQNDITELLDKPVAMYRDPSKEPSVVRRKTLAHVMSSIVEELDSMERKEIRSSTERKSTPPIARISGHPLHRNQQPEAHHPSVDQVSVVLGEISPHQDDRYPEYNFSTSSPSSYSKLNYTETLQRFFRSHPKTVSSDESGDSKMEVSHVDSIDPTEAIRRFLALDCKSSSQRKFSVSGGSGNHKQSQTNSQSQSCSGSGDNYCDNTRQSDSTGNGSGSGDTGRTSSLGHSYKHVQLTEEVLTRHNADMQKMFMQRQRTGVKTPKDKWKIRPIKKTTKRTVERTHGVKRPSAVLEHDTTVHKQAFVAPAARDAGTSLKPPPAEVWTQPDNSSSVPPCGANGTSIDASVGHASRLTAPTFPGIMPGFYLPTSSSNMSSMPSMDSMTVPQPSGPTLVMQHQQPTFIQPQASMAVPLQYMGGFPGMMYQPVGPPLFNAPPLMLPNVVYQHTVVQPPLGQVTIPQQSDGEKPSGAESEQEMEPGKRFAMKRPVVHLHRPDSQATSIKAEPGSARGSNASASGKLICTHSHAAESIRSYLEDTNQLSPCCAPKDIENRRDSSQVSQLSQSTSVQAEAESIGSPGKQEKMVIDQEPRLDASSDMVMSVTSSNYSSGEYKSTDDSLQNLSENSENSETSHSEARWNKPRSKCRRPVLNDPQWLEDVKVTPELLYKYQLETKELVDVLRRDMEMLKRTKQPSWVDDQLSSLYNELELDGSSPDLHLEEGITSSSGEELLGTSAQDMGKRKKKSASYFSRMAMIHEEDAPLPPPDSWECREQHHADSSNSSS